MKFDVGINITLDHMLKMKWKTRDKTNKKNRHEKPCMI